MKNFFTVLILIFALQSWAKADDIKDFQIEGMSIGDSLIDHMSLEDINKNIFTNYYKDGKKRKYYATGYFGSSMYDQVEIYLKNNDKTFKIKAISAFLKKPENCKSKKKKIVDDLKILFKNINPVTYNDIPHSFDKSGNSKQFQTGFLLKNDSNKDHIRVECTYWSDEMKKKNQFVDTLSVGVYSTEVLRWVLRGYK